mgnify:CR=1 FL=1
MTERQGRRLENAECLGARWALLISADYRNRVGQASHMSPFVADMLESQALRASWGCRVEAFLPRRVVEVGRPPSAA